MSTTQTKTAAAMVAEAKSRIENEWVVDSGLHAGDRVVVEGQAKLKPGMQVKPMTVASSDDGHVDSATKASTSVTAASSK